MDHLWTPWRFHYLTRGAGEGCVFCRMIEEDASRDSTNLIVSRGQRVFVVLNLFPYTSGHCLVVPRRHFSGLSEAEPEELADLLLEARRCESALRRIYRPDGFNIGMNLGKCAGAGIEAHLHLHVVPRWVGDANFVSVLGETRVLPEELPETWRRLRAAFETDEID